MHIYPKTEHTYIPPPPEAEAEAESQTITMEELGEYSPPGVLSAECFTSLNSISLSRKRSKNKKRFSDEQIRSLETIFESESKLEPRKKLQLARELGLQPRQVAIWFQNKRARWKSKQLERDYSILRANYNTLASQFEILKKENQSLLVQLQKLNDRVDKSPECCKKEVAENRSIDHGGKSNSGDDDKREFQVKPSRSLSLERSDHGVGVLSEDDNDSSIRADYFGLDEEPTHLLSIVEPADDGSLTSPENWGSLNSNEYYDHSNTSCHWWDFWS